MVMRTILGTPLSGFPAWPGSVYNVTLQQELTKSNVKSSSTDNWFPAADKMLERSNTYTTCSFYKFYLSVTYSYK
jgi:hypothetical protein